MRIHDITDDNIRSQNNIKLWTTISPLYVNYSIVEILKISEMAMAILLAYSTSGITCGEKVSHDLKMSAILKMSKYIPQLKVDIRYEMSVPNYIYEKKVFFMMMTSSMTSQGGREVGLYIHV